MVNCISFFFVAAATLSSILPVLSAPIDRSAMLSPVMPKSRSVQIHDDHSSVEARQLSPEALIARMVYSSKRINRRADPATGEEKAVPAAPVAAGAAKAAPPAGGAPVQKTTQTPPAQKATDGSGEAPAKKTTTQAPANAPAKAPAKKPAQSTAQSAGTGPPLSQKAAEQLFEPLGIKHSSSGGCTDRFSKACTSYETLHRKTADGVIALKKLCGITGTMTITGGTEVGHASGTKTHFNGFKVDLDPTPELTNCINTKFTRSGSRANGDPLFTRGNVIACHERSLNHFDFVFE